MDPEDETPGTDAWVQAQDAPADELQLEAAPADLLADGSDDETADATDPAAVEVVADPETIDALWERYPALREQHEATLAEQLRERENAGANRERARLRREAGQDEVTTRNVKRFLEETGYQVEDPRPLHYFQDLARAHEAEKVVNTVSDVLKTVAPAEGQLRAIEIRDEGVVLEDGTRVPNVEGFLLTLIDEAAETKSEAKLAEARKADEVKNAKWRSDEIKALQAQYAPKTPAAPVAPGGGAPGSPRNPASMGPDEYEQWKQSTAPAEQMRAWAAFAGEPARV